MWRVFKVFPHTERLGDTASSGGDVPHNFQKDKELMASLLEELVKSRTAAAEASKTSEKLLADLILKFERAASDSKIEYDDKLFDEREKAKVAKKLASNAAESRLSSQMLRYETAAAATAEIFAARIVTIRRESDLATKKFSDDLQSKYAIEGFTTNINSEIAIESAEKFVADQKVKYESAVFLAVTMSKAAQKCELEMTARRAEDGIKARVAAEHVEWRLAAQSAKVEQDAIHDKMKLEYELASIAASDASELSMKTLKLNTHIATLFAIKQFDSQILSERTEFEIAAKIAERTNAVTLANQQFKYESAANAATEAYRSSMLVLREDSQTIIDAFNAEMVEKDLKYFVTKLAADRLEQQILTEKLERTAASAQKESELLLTMCGNVAHDLKSPLHTLALSIESLRSLDSGHCSSTSEELLDTLESACGFMRCAISRTIDFTEANSPMGLVPHKTLFNLQVSLSTPIKWMRSLLPTDGLITLVLNPLPSELVDICTDKRWFEENLLCLLSNGVKYSSKGSVCISVALRHGMLRVSVEDHGIGIVMADRPKLFEQISQVQRMTVGGSGLGLYSLSRRSEAIGGACGVDDRDDGEPGSSFWFEIPSASACSSPSLSEKSNGIPGEVDTLTLLTPISPTPSTNIPPLRMLVVDDSIAVVKMLSNKLRSSGHYVVTAKNGEEGLQKMIAMGHSLDVVIMDLQMPVMDGIEATRRYRAWESELKCSSSKSSGNRTGRVSKRLLIICSSANCGEKTMIAATASGVDSFLPKPFDMSALSEALHAASETLTSWGTIGDDEIRPCSTV